MRKGKFDTRTWHEIVGDLIIERTSQGDTIELIIKYNGTSKPNVTLKFHSMDPDKQSYNKEEEISDWLPSVPYYDLIDDTTGKPLEGELRRGFSDWRTYMTDAHGMGPEIQRITKTGGRIFTYQEI